MTQGGVERNQGMAMLMIDGRFVTVAEVARIATKGENVIRRIMRNGLQGKVKRQPRGPK